jgi:hypothetical protein
MLMDAHRGAVDHLHVAVVGLADGGHDAVPNPGFAPANKAVVAGRRRAVFLRQRPPRCARSGPTDLIDVALDRQTIELIDWESDDKLGPGFQQPQCFAKAFGQICSLAVTPSPASYFRESRLRAEVIADALNFNLSTCPAMFPDRL